LRENNTGSFPRGISVMLRALVTWLHEDDPFKLLAFEAPLNEIKSRLSADRNYFEKLIKTHLLDNVHRTTLRFKPDPELGHRFEEEEKARLAVIRESMSAAQLKECVKNTKQLKKLQETPNSPESLATMPFLQLSDLEKQNKTIPIETIQIQDTPVLYHDLFTNGIVYLDLGFDLHALPKELLPLTEIFARALLEMGTKDYDYVKLSQRIGKSTGGIHGNAVSTTVRGSRENVSKLFMRGKATMGQSTELLNILKDILINTNFDNPERLKQIVLEEKSGLESSLIPSGHVYANLRVRAQFGGAGWVNDQMSGIGYLFALRELANDIDKKWDTVLKKLETMRDALINSKSLICNVTLDAERWKTFMPQFENFIFALQEKDLPLKPFDIEAHIEKEGLTIPSQVNYVSKAANLYDLSYEFDGSAEVIIGYLRMAYLWEKVRVQGGAYGAFCAFDSNSGVLSFLSYRDPNLDATLKNFDNTADYLINLDAKSLSDSELTKAIIGTIGDFDAYQLPDAKGYTSMMRYLTGRTDEIRQKERDEILSTNSEDFIAFGEVLKKAAKTKAIAVIGSQSAIEGAKAGLKVTKVL
jgi:Zn-dependent M16 (insulinase) family peptidase